MAEELSEFCSISYHIILDSNIFTCNLKGLVRREAYSVPFFHIFIFSLCSQTGCGTGTESVSSASFLIILYSILIYIYVVWCPHEIKGICWISFMPICIIDKFDENVCQKPWLGPSCEWQLWLGPALKKAKAVAFGPSQAGTSLYSLPILQTINRIYYI